MLVRSAPLKFASLLIAAALWVAQSSAPAVAQNPFAPTAPAPAAPGAAAPAAGTAPAAGAPAPAVPLPAGANPFAPATPAAPAKPAAPAAPGANPFAPAAPATPAPAAPAPAAGGAVAAPAAPVAPIPAGGYRVLAPGVETTIYNPVTAEDRVSHHDIVEIVTEDPTYGVRPTAPNVAPAKNVHFKHDAWGLDFTFKPIRFLRVSGPDGKERLIWYMVYHVRNGPVKRLEAVSSDPNERTVVPVTDPFLFIPHFELESHDVKHVYAERLMPDVVPLIQIREDKNRKLLNTAEITGEIPPSTPEADRSVWGVVTWEGIDPRTDRFSIYVYGLTNAYRWDDPAGAYQKGDPPGKGRIYQSQVLKLNFWRPSDAQDEHEDEIRFGIPGEVDYQWFYK